MNSKEKVLCAVNLQEPDRVPMDFAANKITTERFKKDLNVNSHRQLIDFLKSDIVDIRGVVDPLYKGPVPFERDIGGGVTENFWGWRTKIENTVTGPEPMYCDSILKNASSVQELEKHNWPKVDWFEFSAMKAALRSSSDLAVMASRPSAWQHPSFLRGLAQFLMDLLISPEIAEFLRDKFTDFYVDYFDCMFTKCEVAIDLLRIADDLGMQDRLLISPELFDEFFASRIKRIIDMAKSHNVKVMLHSCGSIISFIDRLIEIGVDILAPIQVTAKDMDPQYIKDNFGSRLCFHGSIDTQYLLPQGSVAETKETVIRMVQILGKNGGFILSPSHLLQNDVPTQNVLALYRAGEALSR